MSRVLATALVILFAILLMVPLLWMIRGSFMPAVDAIKVPPDWTRWTLAGYQKLFRLNPMLLWTRNSLVVCGAVVLFGTLVNTSAGYGLSRDRTPGRSLIFWGMLATVMIPGQVTLIPSLMLVRTLGLYDTLAVMILPALLSPIMVFFYRAYLKSLPREYMDQAQIDGAGEVRRFAQIVAPLTAPALAVMALTAFTGTWSSYFWQLISVRSEELRTIPVGIALAALSYKSLAGAAFVDYGMLMAGATYAFVPMLAVFILAQRHFVESLYGAGIRR